MTFSGSALRMAMLRVGIFIALLGSLSADGSRSLYAALVALSKDVRMQPTGVLRSIAPRPGRGLAILRPLDGGREWWLQPLFLQTAGTRGQNLSPSGTSFAIGRRLTVHFMELREDTSSGPPLSRL